jgi:hypothetical protein
MRRLIVVVGVTSRQSESVVGALLENPDEWYIRGTTGDLTSFHYQVFDSNRNIDYHLKRI